MKFNLSYKVPTSYFGINISYWKRAYISEFVSQALGLSQSFKFLLFFPLLKLKTYKTEFQLITWASKDQTKVNEILNKYGGVVWNLEDGFIRSAGLGSDLTAPASIVLDKTGIYYDPTQISDLESLLQNKQFDAEELSRAGLLQESLLQNELSKYNMGVSIDRSQLLIQGNQRIVLIPGQVEDDASIKKGCVDISTNAALIKRVRENNKNAFLIYKPHPDVVSGNRKGRVDKSLTDSLVDLVLHDESITDCLGIVDEVHTMTSLVGFEGLLRNLKVVCYGVPFYSGWGLTQDSHVIERRTRKLKLVELVHASLIDYPLYMNWHTRTLTTPEVVVEQLSHQIVKQGGKNNNQVSWFTRFIRKIKNFIDGVFF